MNGKLITYEDNCMSLSCRGEMTISNNVVTDIYFKGYPRTIGDEWVHYYKTLKQGDKISKSTIDKILSFNGKRNVVSVFYAD